MLRLAASGSKDPCKQNWHFVLLARLGYAARGVVYLLLGGIALYSVFLGTSEEPSSEGALASLLGQPFGRILLFAMGVGLCTYAAWRLAQALANVDGHDDDIKGYATRAGILVSAAVHMALAVFALRLAVGSDAGSNGGSKDTIADWLMQQPFRRYLLGGSVWS